MRYGRRAFGHQRVMSATTKAKNVAASIKAHGYDTEEASTWMKYGLEANAAQQALVRQALAGK